jgi:hypothetical protein
VALETSNVTGAFGMGALPVSFEHAPTLRRQSVMRVTSDEKSPGWRTGAREVLHLLKLHMFARFLELALKPDKKPEQRHIKPPCSSVA